MGHSKNWDTPYHKTAYATLVGRVDAAITYLESMVADQTCDWFHVMEVAGLLEDALLEAEEQYIEYAEDEPRLIVLPQNKKEPLSP